VTNAADAIDTAIGTITIEFSLQAVASAERWHGTTAARLSLFLAMLSQRQPHQPGCRLEQAEISSVGARGSR